MIAVVVVAAVTAAVVVAPAILVAAYNTHKEVMPSFVVISCFSLWEYF